MEGQFTQVVEQAMGRRVIAFMSQIHFDPGGRLHACGEDARNVAT
jgi:hypothetical protein